VDAEKYRSWVASRQGLIGKKYSTARQALLGAGWQRSVGGVSPYLAIRARSGEGRQQMDDLAVALELFELPSARSCTYVLPAEHFALGLAVAAPHSGITELAAARKFGMPQDELDRLKTAVTEILQGGPLSPADMKPLLGDKVRNFGEEGKKKGLTTSLPLALSLLQTEGIIRRKPANGRLDTQRYDYELWNPPVANIPDAEAAARELAHCYFGWTGAATLKEFREFSLLSAKVAAAAAQACALEPLEPGSDLLALPGAAAEYAEYTGPDTPDYRFVGCIDSYLLNRRGSQFWLAECDSHIETPTQRGLKTAGELTELSSHAILDRGRLIGLWEFDAAEGEVVWFSWIKPPTDALRQAATETEAYVRAELGDARSFSLDSPKSRQPKLEALRSLKAQYGC
jgi:Winged helix DNA-binding domain